MYDILFSVQYLYISCFFLLFLSSFFFFPSRADFTLDAHEQTVKSDNLFIQNQEKKNDFYA